jgi:hypothetical protein
MRPSEIVFCIAILLPLIPMAIFKQWRLFWVFMTFYLCFGLQEWLSVAQTGQSISQHFWILDIQHPWQGWVIVGSMALMWGALIVHFKKHKR